MVLYYILRYCMVLYYILRYCMVLHCWLRRAGCISQDTYLLYLFESIIVECYSFGYGQVAHMVVDHFSLHRQNIISLLPSSVCLGIVPQYQYQIPQYKFQHWSIEELNFLPAFGSYYYVKVRFLLICIFVCLYFSLLWTLMQSNNTFTWSGWAECIPGSL